MEKFFSLNNDYILEDSSDFFYPIANVYATYPYEYTFVNMLICSDEVQPSTALFYISSQQPRQMEINIHPAVIPLHSTLVFPPSEILILFNKIKIQEQWQ